MRSSRRGLCILSIAAVTAALAILTPASASAAQPMPVPPATSGDSGVLVKPTEVPKYARHSLSAAAKMSAKETCTPTTDKTSVCLETIAPVKPDLAAPKATRAAVQPFPEWCADSTGTPVSGSRTEACQVNGLRYTTRLTVNGTTTVTGQVTMNVFNYTFASVNLPNWQHQIGIAPLPGGWGPAAGATLTATFGVDGDCYTIGTPDFPAQALSPLDNVMRTGTAGAETTATAVDARGSCTTSWTFTATTPGYSDSSRTYEMWETDCDNATGANGFRPARVGCAVWWFPAIVYYSRSTHPTLADHVAKAQASGLPGDGFEDPLYRNKTDATITLNRNLACGNAPSIAGKTCDEYPLATTYEGLAFGGTLRTFAGCNITAPTGVTGPIGASACMITGTENNSQGGIMAKFNYDNRVLAGDPFRVHVID